MRSCTFFFVSGIGLCICDSTFMHANFSKFLERMGLHGRCYNYVVVCDKYLLNGHVSNIILNFHKGSYEYKFSL